MEQQVDQNEYVHRLQFGAISQFWWNFVIEVVVMKSTATGTLTLSLHKKLCDSIK